MRLRYFPALGTFIGLLSAMVVTTGPLNTPFFLAYWPASQRLRGDRGRVLDGHAPGARGDLARYALLTRETVIVGLVLGGTMFCGHLGGRRLLDRMSDRVFLGIIEVMLVVMGLHSLLFPR